MSVINGRSGEKDGEKILKPLFDAIIDSELKKKFTWTGRTNLGKTKMAFMDYKEVTALLFAVVHLADSNYTTKQCQHDVTYRVLKHAEAKKKGFVINLISLIKYHYILIISNSNSNSHIVFLQKNEMYF